MISPEAFRDALRYFAAGVTIVTSRWGDRRHGMTVSAFVSVSAQPPLVAVLIDQAHAINALLEPADAVFAVNFLAEDQAELSHRFAFEKTEDRFLVGDWQTAVTGAPVLVDSLAWLDCKLCDRMRAGSHTIYLGEVQASQVNRPEAGPLAYWNRDYRRFDLAGSALANSLQAGSSKR